MADETTQADATALVAMTVADLAEHLDGVDLPTLEAALTAEKLGFNRKGALAALEAAIAGHPEAAASAAEAAEAAPSEEQAAERSTQPPDAAPEAPAVGQTGAENAEADATESPVPEAPAEDAEPAPEDAPAEEGDEAVLSGPAAPWTATHFLMTHPDGGTCDAFETDEATGALLVPIGREGELFPHGFVVSGETKIEA